MEDSSDGDKVDISALQKSLFAGPKGINILALTPGAAPPRIRKNSDDPPRTTDGTSDDKTTDLLPEKAQLAEKTETTNVETVDSKVLTSVCKRRVKKQGARPPSRAFVRKSMCLLDSEENVFSINIDIETTETEAVKTAHMTESKLPKSSDLTSPEQQPLPEKLTSDIELNTEKSETEIKKKLGKPTPEGNTKTKISANTDNMTDNEFPKLEVTPGEKSKKSIDDLKTNEKFKQRKQKADIDKLSNSQPSTPDLKRTSDRQHMRNIPENKSKSNRKEEPEDKPGSKATRKIGGDVYMSRSSLLRKRSEENDTASEISTSRHTRSHSSSIQSNPRKTYDTSSYKPASYNSISTRSSETSSYSPGSPSLSSRIRDRLGRSRSSPGTKISDESKIGFSDRVLGRLRVRTDTDKTYSSRLTSRTRR